MALDTISNNIATTGLVAVGGSVDGVLEVSGDQDWYRVSLVAGQLYRFNLVSDATPPPGNAALGDPLLRLFDPTGTLVLAQNDDSGGTLDSSITFLATSTTDYFVSAQAFGASTGAFTLQVANVTAGDPGDVAGNLATGATVAVGGSVTGTLGFGGDEDWYGVSLAAGQTYRFNLQGASSGEGTLADPLLRLLNGAGAQLAQNDDAGLTLDSSVVFAVGSSGTYYLSAQGFGASVGTFRLAVADISPAGGDVPGDTGTVATVAVGGSVTGSVDFSGDQDWHGVTLVAGNTYSFTLQGAQSGEGTLADPVLRLLDGLGLQISLNDDAGGMLESALVVTATFSGIHFLSAEGYGGDLGTYRLAVADLGAGPADVGQTTATAAGLTVGASATGALGFANDQDWYAVDLDAGHQYRFDLHGVSNGGGTLVDPVLRLLNGAGAELASNDDSGGTLDSLVVFAPLASGTYYVSAQGFTDSTGSFTLSAAEITGAAGDVPAGIGANGANPGVAIGGAVGGTIDAGGDQDWYRVQLAAGVGYRFDLHGADSAAGSLADPFLRLLGSTGLVFASDDDGGAGFDSQLFFTPFLPGTYYLSAEGFGENAGTYVLEADFAVPGADVGSTTLSAVAMYAGGTVDGTLGSGGDQDWYSIALVAGRDYVFELQGFDSGLGTLSDPYLRLLDGAGAEITFDDDSGEGLESRLVYTASQTGTHHLSAQSYLGFTSGSFVLRAADVTSTVDVLGGAGTGSTAPVGGAVASQIDASGDQDWFRVTLVAGHSYAFDLQGASSANGSLADPLLRLLDGAGAQLAIDDDSGLGLDASILHTAAQSGSYYLSAQGYSGSSGDYVLRVFDFDDTGDVPGSIASTEQVPVGGSILGAIGGDADEDWYAVQLVAGHGYRFDLQGAAGGEGSLANPLLRARDSAGLELVVDDDSFGTADSMVTVSALSDLTVFLAVEGVGSSTGTFRLSVTDSTAIAPDVPADTGTTRNVLADGWITGFTTGNLPGSFAYDDDWYRIQLTGTHTYTFTLRGSPSGVGTLDDPFLQLLDSGGLPVAATDPAGGLAHDNYFGAEAQLSFTPASAGTYYVSAGGFDETSVGSYELYIDDSVAFPDVPATTGGALGLPAGMNLEGVIGAPGDQDWYAVTLVAGREYTFGVQGTSLGYTLTDPFVELRDSFGALVAADDDSGPGNDAAINFRPSSGGTYYLAARDAAGGAGTFVVFSGDNTLAPVDVPGGVQTASTLTVGGSAAGTIDSAGDQDWFAIALTFNHTYHFVLQGQSSEQGTLADPLLRLFNDGATLVATNDNGGAGLESHISFTPLVAGTNIYYLSAQGVGGDTGSYALSAIDSGIGLADYVPGSVAATDRVAIGSFTRGRVDNASDQDWYRVELVGGHSYRFVLDNPALSDVTLRLMNAAGSQLQIANANGVLGDEQIDFVPGQSGIYYLAAQGTAIGNFHLDASDLGSAEVPGNASFAGSIAGTGGVVMGTIGAGADEDWYAVTLNSSTAYTFELKGAGSGDGTLADGYLRLYNNLRTEVAADDNSGAGNDALISSYTPPSSGTYYLAAHGISGAMGSYQLTSIISADVGASTLTIGNIPVGGELVGTTGTTFDADWYRVSLVQDHAYRIDLRGADSGGGTLADPYLILRDSSGFILDTDDDSGEGVDSMLEFTPGSSGTYFLDAGDFGSATGTYTLSIEETTVDFNPIFGTGSADTLTGTEFTDVVLAGGGNDHVEGKAGFDAINGEDGDDILSGGEGDDVVWGGNGNDRFLHETLESYGDDVLFGEAGDDTLEDGYGFNSLDGGEGNDRLVVFLADPDGVSWAAGGGGSDTYVVRPRDVALSDYAWLASDFQAGIGGDVLDLTALLDASAAARHYVAGTSDIQQFLRLQQSGADTLVQWDRDGGGDGFVTLLALKDIEADKIESYNIAGALEVGSKLNDALIGAEGNDIINGAGGNDTLDGGAGADRMIGGDNSDTYYVDDPKDDVVETDNDGLVTGKNISGPIDTVISSITYLLLSYVENLVLAPGAGNLTGFGNALDNVISGNEGNNLLFGDAGSDELAGGPGNDVLSGGTGNDMALYASAGAPVSVSLALLSVAQPTGGAGTDTLISIEALTGSGFADTLTGSAGNDSLLGGNGLDSLVGGAGNDDLRGNDQADTLFGDDGNDFLGGGKGHDSLEGGENNDTLAGLVGNDTLAGGNGVDLADYSGSSDAVTVNLLTGSGGSTLPVVGAGSGVDVLNGIENILGGAHADNLTGDALANALTGGLGNDTISADTGFDTLDGGEGNDSLLGGLQQDQLLGGNGNDTLGGGNGFDNLNGGDGNDILRGALGTDVLTGGNGADHFVFGTALDGVLNIDTLTDFVSGTDVIELSKAIFANVSGAVGATVGLSVNLTYDSGTGVLQYDADGAGVNPGMSFAILGTSIHPAVGSDFLIVN